MNIQVGDRLLMKKAHPCGGKIWLVTRIGMDFRLVCETCQRGLLMPRAKAEKQIRKVMPAEDVTKNSRMAPEELL